MGSAKPLAEMRFPKSFKGNENFMSFTRRENLKKIPHELYHVLDTWRAAASKRDAPQRRWAGSRPHAPPPPPNVLPAPDSCVPTCRVCCSLHVQQHRRRNQIPEDTAVVLNTPMR
jgi:hypothetical protein